MMRELINICEGRHGGAGGLRKRRNLVWYQQTDNNLEIWARRRLEDTAYKIAELHSISIAYAMGVVVFLETNHEYLNAILDIVEKKISKLPKNLSPATVAPATDSRRSNAS